MNNLYQIRENEKLYHTDFYKSNKLYEKGSWIQKPVDSVLDAFSLLDNKHDLSVLDIGSGVGRNCIEVARRCSDDSVVECIDILPTAINLLEDNADIYNVDHIIQPKVCEIESFKFRKLYDFIIAVSVLEHVANKNFFIRILEDIREHLKINGIACLIINSEVKEFDITNNVNISPQFEVNLNTEELLVIIHKIFKDMNIIKQEIKPQKYVIQRSCGDVVLKTNAVTFIIVNES